MSTNKNIDRICAIITLCAVLLTVIFMNGRSIGIQAIVDEDAESYKGTEYFTANDMNGSWDTDDATVISLTGDGADVQGEGVYSYDGDVYIAAAGKYVLSGKLDDGSIVVDAYDSSKVFLYFDGVDITCTDDAGLKVEQADKVFVTLAEGTENSIICGENYSEKALKDEVTGAVFSHDDLTINGSGSLTVSTGYMHGITGKDDVVIAGGRISISAPADGINANDSLRIMAADITINAADDGIHSDGAFYIESGSLTINDCYEGIEAVTIDIAGGETIIYSQDDGLNANGGSGDMFGMGGPPGGMGGDPASMNGISGNRGGRPGPMNGVSGNRGGRPADMNGLSGNMGGRSGSMNGFPGNHGGGPGGMGGISGNKGDRQHSTDNAENTSEEVETYIHISGGRLTVINATGRDADGIDSNGDLLITGGEIRVSLVNNGSNSALDYASESGGVATISGGSVIACGGSSMAEQFDDTSTQPSILYIYSEGAEAGTKVALEDKDGNVIISYEAPQSFSAVNISCPELKVGESYRIVIGDMVEEFTLEETAASLGDSAGGFGGGRNFGGMPPGGDFGGTPPEGDFGGMPPEGEPSGENGRI